MRALWTGNLNLACIATTALIAQMLETASKLTLDRPLWLAIQRHPHRG